jgi:uncharacterized Zn finger protein
MYFDWKPYVPVAKRREQAARLAAKLERAGQKLLPVAAARGPIAKTFWGKAWCENLERYSDYSSRLPRGRTYLRNGSVIDLKIAAGEVVAQVVGSSLYRIKVNILAVPAPQWRSIARDCAQSIDSWVELLQGKLSTGVMERIARPGAGLFPSPREITLSCSCPDAASMCKHVAATLYGIGARLDAEPELLFILRKVDAKELVARVGEGGVPVKEGLAASRVLDSSRLADVFGIDLVPGEAKAPGVGVVGGRRMGKKVARKKVGESAGVGGKGKRLRAGRERKGRGGRGPGR